MNSEIQEPVKAISDARSSSKSPLRILVMMLAVLFGLLVYQNFRPTEYDEFIGQKFDYSGVSYSGKVINRESLQGSVVVVNFWATYCPFCLEDIEYLKDLQQALRHNDLKPWAQNTRPPSSGAPQASKAGQEPSKKNLDRHLLLMLALL